MNEFVHDVLDWLIGFSDNN